MNQLLLRLCRCLFPCLGALLLAAATPAQGMARKRLEIGANATVMLSNNPTYPAGTNLGSIGVEDRYDVANGDSIVMPNGVLVTSGGNYAGISNVEVLVFTNINYVVLRWTQNGIQTEIFLSYTEIAAEVVYY